MISGNEASTIIMNVKCDFPNKCKFFSNASSDNQKDTRCDKVSNTGICYCRINIFFLMEQLKREAGISFDGK